RARYLPERVAALRAAQEILERARGQLAVIAGPLYLLERVSTRAQARDHAYIRRRRRGPATVIAGHQSPRDPASDGPGRYARARRDVCQRQLAGLVLATIVGLVHASAPQQRERFRWGFPMVRGLKSSRR